MALKVRLKRMVAQGPGRAILEIAASDSPDEALAVETMNFRMKVPLAEMNIRSAKASAVDRIAEICAEMSRELKE